MKHIRLSHTDYTAVNKLLENNRKIEAIKYVRLHGCMSKEDQNDPPSNVPSGIGLREAKDAVESLTSITGATTCTIIPPLRIKKIILEGEEGDIELDMDGLQLRLLDGLGSLPLSYMASSMELMQYLRSWDNFSTAEK
jgi:hypothetical protein